MDALPSPSGLVRHRMLVLVALGLLVYVAPLGLRDLWYPDEPDIAEVCRAMYLSGDWIVPRSNGEPWVDYWPLMYWAGTAASAALGAMSEFSLRLPSALGAILLALCTCAAASHWLGARAGLWAGVVLLTSPQFAHNATSYRPDALFSVMIGAGMFSYAAGAGERARWGPRAAGFALFGLAVLVKGPLGVLLPGLVLTLWHGARRELRRILELAPLTLVTLAVALPWAFACADAMGSELFWNAIYTQNFTRFEQGGLGHVQPVHYFLERIWLDVAPWSPLLPFAIWWLARSPLRRDRNVQLALLWFGTWFVFLSIATTKRQLYLMPAYPAIALLLAPYLAALGRAEDLSGDRAVEAAAGLPPPDPRPARVLVAALSVLLALVCLAAVVGAVALDPLLARLDLEPFVAEVVRHARLPALAIGAVTGAAALWIGRACLRADLPRALGRAAAASVALYAAAFGLCYPVVNPLKTYAPEGRWIRAQIGPEETEIGLYWPALAHHKQGGFAYYTGARVALLADEAAVAGFLREHPGSLVLAHEDVAMELFQSERTDWRKRVVRELVAGRYRYFVLRAA